MKVRVPKNLRPPERYKAFFWPPIYGVKNSPPYFRCTGVFRIPKNDEWYWSSYAEPARSFYFASYIGPRVILEPVYVKQRKT